MANKVMITCAVTGSIHTPSMSPALPSPSVILVNNSSILFVPILHGTHLPHDSVWLK